MEINYHISLYGSFIFTSIILPSLPFKYTHQEDESEHLGTLRERVGYIIIKDLEVRKLSAKWVPKSLKKGKKTSKVPVL
jgi:hypothetical protein